MLETIREKTIVRVEIDPTGRGQSFEIGEKKGKHVRQSDLKGNHQDIAGAVVEQAQDRGFFKIFIPFLLIILSFLKSNNYQFYKSIILRRTMYSKNQHTSKLSIKSKLTCMNEKHKDE